MYAREGEFLCCPNDHPLWRFGKDVERGEIMSPRHLEQARPDLSVPKVGDLLGRCPECDERLAAETFVVRGIV